MLSIGFVRLLKDLREYLTTLTVSNDSYNFLDWRRGSLSKAASFADALTIKHIIAAAREANANSQWLKVQN